MTLVQLKYAIAVAGERSLNEAAKSLFISQPTLSAAMHSLEEEIGIQLFRRSKSGIQLTAEGEEFIGYARQVTEQYDLLHEKYVDKKIKKKKFCVSMQHDIFAVKAFANTIRKIGMDEYEFSIHETKTHEVLKDVKEQKSELGILYLNEFNHKVLGKIFQEYGLEFHALFHCATYIYTWKGHPLAQKQELTLEELAEYPYLSFEQGEYNSFYFSEEAFSTHPYRKMIKVNDRATMLNLMVELNGFTLCSGIICKEFNGDDYCAIKLKEQDEMAIGYVAKKRCVP